MGITKENAKALFPFQTLSCKGVHWWVDTVTHDPTIHDQTEHLSYMKYLKRGSD